MVENRVTPTFKVDSLPRTGQVLSGPLGPSLKDGRACRTHATAFQGWPLIYPPLVPFSTIAVTCPLL